MNLQELEVQAGESRTLTLYARDTSNNPQDLTSRTVAWLVGRPPFDPGNRIAVIEKTGTVTNAAGGVYTVTLDPADTLGRSGKYVHMGLVTESGALTFINNLGGVLQFVNDSGGNLYFFNDSVGFVEVITTGRFSIRDSVGN